MSSNISVCMCSSIWCMTTLHFATKGWAVQKTLSSLLCSAALTHWISVGQLGNAGQGHFRKLCGCEMRYWGQVLLPHQVSEPSVYPKVAWSPWVKVSERYRVSGPMLSSNTLLLPFHGQHSHSGQGNIFHQFIPPPPPSLKCHHVLVSCVLWMLTSSQEQKVTSGPVLGLQC